MYCCLFFKVVFRIFFSLCARRIHLAKKKPSFFFDLESLLYSTVVCAESRRVLVPKRQDGKGVCVCGLCACITQFSASLFFLFCLVKVFRADQIKGALGRLDLQKFGTNYASLCLLSNIAKPVFKVV